MLHKILSQNGDVLYSTKFPELLSREEIFHCNGLHNIGACNGLPIF